MKRQEQSITCLNCGNAKAILDDSPRLKGFWPPWMPGLQDFKCPECRKGPIWASDPYEEGVGPV